VLPVNGLSPVFGSNLSIAGSFAVALYFGPMLRMLRSRSSPTIVVGEKIERRFCSSRKYCRIPASGRSSTRPAKTRLPPELAATRSKFANT